MPRDITPTTERIDCHVHVLDPQRFAYAADAPFRPEGGEIGTAAYLGEVLDAYGVRHALIVGPNSGYNLDNRCLLDALAQGAGRYRGIAVLRSDTGRDQLQELQAQGIVGVAFQAALYGVDHYRDIGPLLGRLRELGLWADVQVQHDQLVQMRPLLEDSGVQLLFDHCGRPDPRAGVGRPGFEALLALAATGRAHVKLSGLGKCSALPYPHSDAWPFVRALLDAYTPQGLLWASDWPFLRPSARIDYGTVQTLFERLVPDPADRRAILWDTPRRLLGFGDEPVR